MSEADKQTANEDQSMEEILQSIRRIITEEEAENSTNDVADNNDAEDDSDILELTEVVEEGDKVVDDETTHSDDVLSNIDAALGVSNSPDKASTPPVQPDVTEDDESEDPAEGDPFESLAVDDPQPEAFKEPETSQTRSNNATQQTNSDNETLLSQATATATSALFEQLKKAPPQMDVSASSLPSFSSGMTMEHLIMETMRPMLKSWLDDNLPHIVETVVEREVKKLI